MPLDRIGECRCLGLRLLDPVLAERREAGRDSRSQDLRSKGLRDRDQPDVAG
jgi:hypothetical protein